MKSCIKCGADLDDSARFCSNCGAVQPEKKPAAETTNGAGSAMQMGKELAMSLDKMTKAAYIGVGIIILSVVTPIITVAGMVDVTFMDVSKLLMLVIIAVGAYGAYAVTHKAYGILPVLAHGLVFFALVGCIRYQMIMSELKKSFLGAMAGQALKIEWGFYLFVLGALVMCVSGLILSIIAEGRTLSGEVFVQQWKASFTQKLAIGSMKLQGWIFSAAIAVIMLVVVMQSNAIKNLL